MGQDDEVLIELKRIGGAVQVNAVSGRDGLEVSFMAPAHTPMPELERLAAGKLAWVRSRETQGAGSPRPPSGKRGFLA